MGCTPAGKKFGRGGILGYNFLLGCIPLMSNKCGKLYGVSGFNNFFTRLGVTTEFCWGDYNVSGVHRGETNVYMKGV